MTTQKQKKKPKMFAVILSAQGAPLVHMLGTKREVCVNKHLINPGNGVLSWTTPCSSIFPGDRDTGDTRVAPTPGKQLVRHRKPMRTHPA